MQIRMVSAAISVCGGSDWFTMDIEDETVSKNFEEIKLTAKDDAKVTTKQITRLYAIGQEAGRNVQEIKQLLATKGITSTKDITQAQYDDICKLVGEQ